ncbi:tetratricopeptide repeat protein [Paenibacillus sp. A14]|uniref:tetratricopeptide repeat protein n=1 Tax=Paenibacillus sp. A14 TaxID=3119820 RepID=UPI002FE0DFBB
MKELSKNQGAFLSSEEPGRNALVPDAETRLLEQGTAMGRSGASDPKIAGELAQTLEHMGIPTDAAKAVLFRTLVRLGAYRQARDCYGGLLNPTEETFLLYLRCLFHCGEPKLARDEICARKQRISQCSESKHFKVELDRLDLLARLILDWKGERISGNPRSLEENTALIQCAVESGQITIATKLAAGHIDDPYLACALIRTLYAEGYVDRAREWLAQLEMPLLQEGPPPYREIAYIYGEMRYDEGLYDEAAAIFERLAASTPDMAEARFAACSCFLHAAVSRLTGRVALYRPDEAERAKIEKHLNELYQALRMISSVPWHTDWTYAQRRNFPRQADGTRPH